MAAICGANHLFGSMIEDPKSLVARGYDTIADAYLERYARSAVRDHWLGKLITLLSKDARVLDLGCGAGIPVARELAALGFPVSALTARPGRFNWSEPMCPQPSSFKPI